MICEIGSIVVYILVPHTISQNSRQVSYSASKFTLQVLHRR